MYVATSLDSNFSISMVLARGNIKCFIIPFVHKSLQNYNDFVWTVTWLNRDMNNSYSACRLPIRKPGPHNSRGSVGPLK